MCSVLGFHYHNSNVSFVHTRFCSLFHCPHSASLYPCHFNLRVPLITQIIKMIFLIYILLTPTVTQSRVLFSSSLNRNDGFWLGISASHLFIKPKLLTPWKTNEFPLTLFPLGIFHAQWSPRLRCHLLCTPQAFSGPQSFPLILHPPGSRPPSFLITSHHSLSPPTSNIWLPSPTCGLFIFISVTFLM